jgi:hypothetical protein
MATFDLKSIDTMKASRDSNSWTNADKIAHINAIVKWMPDCTHITCASYINNFGYQSVAYIKEWFDAIHAVGKHVLFRPAFAGGTSSVAVINATLLQGISDLAACWATGDSWDVIPESSPTSSAFNQGSGAVAGWNQWVRDVIPLLQNTFMGMGLTVDCSIFSQTDQTFIFNSRVEADTLTAMGNKLCIDFYPMDIGSDWGKVLNLVNEIRSARANYPTANIWITETGYNNTTLVGDENQRLIIRDFVNEIRNVPYIKGLNYWHGYGNSQFDKCLTFQSLSVTQVRPSFYSLGEFFTKGACNSRQRII